MTADHNDILSIESKSKISLWIMIVSDSISLLKLKLKRVKDLIRTGNDENNFSAFDSLVTDYLTSVQAIFGTTPFEDFSVAFWRKNLLALVNKYNPNYDSDRLLLVQIVLILLIVKRVLIVLIVGDSA